MSNEDLERDKGESPLVEEASAVTTSGKSKQRQKRKCTKKTKVEKSAPSTCDWMEATPVH